MGAHFLLLGPELLVFDAILSKFLNSKIALVGLRWLQLAIGREIEKGRKT